MMRLESLTASPGAAIVPPPQQENAANTHLSAMLGSSRHVAQVVINAGAGSTEVSQICAAIVAAKGNWMVAVRYGELLPPAVLTHMCQKPAALVAVRTRHPDSRHSEVISTIRGIVSPMHGCEVPTYSDQVFAGAMSLPPYIHQSFLRLAGDNAELPWPKLIMLLSELFILRAVSREDVQLAGGGSFARSKIVSVFRKEAKGLGVDKLRDEIDFLKKLPASLKPLYPTVLSVEEPDSQTLVMNQEVIQWPTVRSHLLREKTDVSEIIQRLRALLYLLKRVSYDVNILPTPSDYIERLHFQRVRQRMELTCKMCPMFRELIAAREVVINGNSHQNICELVSLIEGSRRLRDLVTPAHVSPLAHGDLHFDNILFDINSSDAKLVDPRGYEYCDIYYDLGKLNHSVNGKYDLIHEGLFELSCEVRGGLIEASLRFPDENLVRTYDSIRAHLHVWSSEVTNDDLAPGRIRFNEAMHFAADMPFHLRDDGEERRARAIYLTAILLLSRFKSEWL